MIRSSLLHSFYLIAAILVSPVPAYAYLGPSLGFAASTVILIVAFCIILSLYFLFVQPLVKWLKAKLKS